MKNQLSGVLEWKHDCHGKRTSPTCCARDHCVHLLQCVAFFCYFHLCHSYSTNSPSLFPSVIAQCTVFIMDSILGCYKDGTNNTRNCRSFGVVIRLLIWTIAMWKHSGDLSSAIALFIGICGIGRYTTIQISYI